LRRPKNEAEMSHVEAGLQTRLQKAVLEPSRAYATAWEEEPDAGGVLVPTAVVFLTNRECPFRCTMCDLWTHTLDERVGQGAIASQIRHALTALPPARHIKLYNAGSFFDPQAIPPDDYAEIAGTVRSFDRVIVEAHPAFLSGAGAVRGLQFRDLLTGPLRGPRPTRARRPGLAEQPRLEVAIGLETAHEPTLARLNKRMTVDDVRRAAAFLGANDIALRLFVLLNPPGLSGDEAVEWACRSIDVAVECGAEVCSIIPTRDVSGIMPAPGHYERPRLPALERVVGYGLERGGIRVFADLWDVERFFDCECSSARADRLREMNRSQKVVASVSCGCSCPGTSPRRHEVTKDD
jgi:archaeosine synthase beta-subunit